MTLSQLVNIPFGLSCSPPLHGFSESYGILKLLCSCLKRKREENKEAFPCGKAGQSNPFHTKRRKKRARCLRKRFTFPVCFSRCLCGSHTMNHAEKNRSQNEDKDSHYAQRRGKTRGCSDLAGHS